MISDNLKNRVHKVVFALYLVLVFSLGFMKPALDSAFTAIAPTDLIFPLFFVCWLGSILIGAHRLEWNPAYWAFLIYLTALLFSSIFSVNPALSFGKLAGVVYLVVLAVTTASVVSTIDQLRFTLFAWLAGSILPVLVALIGVVIFYIAPESEPLKQITYHYGAVPIGYFPRISSTFVSASMFCNYLTVTFALALLSKRMNWIRNEIAFAVTASVAIAAISTVSIAIGGLFLVVAIWIWIADTRSLVSRLALSSAIVVAVMFFAIAPVALWNQAGTDGFTPSSRLLVWKSAINTFIADPITGRGLGVGAASVTYQNSDGTWSLLTDAHNVFLNVAAESGVIGLAALLLLIFAILRAAFAGKNGGGLRLVRIGLGVAFVSAFIYDGLTGSFEDARHLWVLMGLIIAAERISSAKP